MRAAQKHEAALHAFIDLQIRCDTCVHAVRLDLFGAFCEQPGMAGGWNPRYSCCEEHDFVDVKLEAELQRLSEIWYAEWLEELRIQEPETYAIFYDNRITAGV